MMKAIYELSFDRGGDPDSNKLLSQLAKYYLIRASSSSVPAPNVQEFTSLASNRRVGGYSVQKVCHFDQKIDCSIFLPTIDAASELVHPGHG
jgi:hypothetical protein